MQMDLTFDGRLQVPLIVSPMFLVSCPELLLAVSSEGAMGTFPAHSTRTPEDFEEWIVRTKQALEKFENPGPWAVNLVVHPTNKRMVGDLDLCIKHKVPVVLTSKGAPKDVFKDIHAYGGIVFHDIASARHAEKALEAGADGLIAVCSGAGGHTGRTNPFALLNEIRSLTDKPIILSGGMSTGADILAAQMMGADLVYMGTRFINANESLASAEYRSLLAACSAKDVFFTTALDGAPANFLTPSLKRAGIDPNELAASPPGAIVDPKTTRKRYSGIFSAGHGVGMVSGSEPGATIVRRIKNEYQDAIARFSNRFLVDRPRGAAAAQRQVADAGDARRSEM